MKQYSNKASTAFAAAPTDDELDTFATDAAQKVAASAGKDVSMASATVIGGANYPCRATSFVCTNPVYFVGDTCMTVSGGVKYVNGYKVTEAGGSKLSADSLTQAVAATEASSSCSSGRRLDEGAQKRRGLQTSGVPYDVILTVAVDSQPDGTSDDAAVQSAMTSLPTGTIVYDSASVAAVTVTSVAVTETASTTTSAFVTAPPPPSPAVGGISEAQWSTSCVESCTTFEDGASMSTPLLCAKFEGTNYIRCKPSWGGSCDSGMELCINHQPPSSPPSSPSKSCEDKQDKKGKWRKKKCPNKIAVKAQKCNKKKIKRKCRKTCCIAGY